MLKAIVSTLLVACVPIAAYAKQPAQNARAQTMLLASMVDGLCEAKEHSQGTTITPTTTALTDAEKDQCAYVRMGLRNGCFERGDCQPFEQWRSVGRARH